MTFLEHLEHFAYDGEAEYFDIDKGEAKYLCKKIEKLMNYENMKDDIKNYLDKNKNEIFSGESERIIEDIEEIIENWEEDYE